MSSARERPIATLWNLVWNEHRLSCVVHRIGNNFELSVESPGAVIVAEPFEIGPRAMSRAHALRESLKRRGWRDAT